jgi:hypothetical protein
MTEIYTGKVQAAENTYKLPAHYSLAAGAMLVLGDIAELTRDYLNAIYLKGFENSRDALAKLNTLSAEWVEAVGELKQAPKGSVAWSTQSEIEELRQLGIDVSSLGGFDGFRYKGNFYTWGSTVDFGKVNSDADLTQGTSPVMRDGVELAQKITVLEVEKFVSFMKSMVDTLTSRNSQDNIQFNDLLGKSLRFDEWLNEIVKAIRETLSQLTRI